MQRETVLLVNVQVVVAGESLGLLRQVFMKLLRQCIGSEPADFAHDKEHRVLHCRIGDAAGVPYPPCKEDIDKACNVAELKLHYGFAVIGFERRQQ